MPDVASSRLHYKQIPHEDKFGSVDRKRGRQLTIAEMMFYANIDRNVVPGEPNLTEGIDVAKTLSLN